MAFTIPWNLIGLQVSGDIGHLTIYTDRFGKKVAFNKSPPKEPPSPEQVNQRNRFKTAQKNYMDQSNETKLAYENATKKTSIAFTGQNLWISVSFSQDFESLRTLEKQSGEILTNPETV